MTDDSLLPFALPSVQRKKVTAAFDGGRISSDGGVMLLALAERRIGIADKLAAEIADRRDPARVTHLLADILRARILAIACGYEDGDDLDHLRRDPALKLACGHLPDSGRDLCSQPTVSRTENTPGLREVIKLMRAMVALYCRSYPKPPEAVTLDIDDTLDVVHGQPSAAIAVQRALRRALLLADPRLRHRDLAPRRCAAAAGQDPVRTRAPRPSAPPAARDPPPLAAHPHHHPRRQPLRAARGDGVV
jgi:hypothetical protein